MTTDDDKQFFAFYWPALALSGLVAVTTMCLSVTQLQQCGCSSPQHVFNATTHMMVLDSELPYANTTSRNNTAYGNNTRKECFKFSWHKPLDGNQPDGLQLCCTKRPPNDFPSLFIACSVTLGVLCLVPLLTTYRDKSPWMCSGMSSVFIFPFLVLELLRSMGYFREHETFHVHANDICLPNVFISSGMIVVVSAPYARWIQHGTLEMFMLFSSTNVVMNVVLLSIADLPSWTWIVYISLSLVRELLVICALRSKREDWTKSFGIGMIRNVSFLLWNIGIVLANFSWSVFKVFTYMLVCGFWPKCRPPAFRSRFHLLDLVGIDSALFIHRVNMVASFLIDDAYILALLIMFEGTDHPTTFVKLLFVCVLLLPKCVIPWYHTTSSIREWLLEDMADPI